MSDHTKAWEKFDDWIKQGIEMRASDLHLVPGYKPSLRVDGTLKPIDDMILNSEQTHWIGVCLFGNSVSYELAGAGARHLARTHGDIIVDITVASAGGNKTVCVRMHGGEIPSFEKVDLPERTIELLKAPNGIILVAGPNGSGKTTTLYSMTDWINANRAVHICTVEQPRHYVFKRKQAIVQQREVGLDGPSAATLVEVSMKQDPDVIMVGDVEDFETLAGILHAAETGHLVLVQVHAKDARDAVERIIDAAPQSMHTQVKRQLGECLRGITIQRLAKFADGKVRRAVYDVMNESARKLVNGATPDAGYYLARAVDQVGTHEKAGSITREEGERLRHEFGA
ncbi:MAG: Flp pilus assembly complex ATPase component TadA [Planctomycetes bacterium]|nr:Flp pilus assembly complex ATPase component TadA [Planctomycetota bacterium]